MKPYDLGVILWAVQEPAKVMADIRSVGATCAQLGVPGELDLEGTVEAWQDAVRDFPIVSIAAAYCGESYADIPTVVDTVGIIPHRFREERVERTLAVADFAARLGVPSITAHIGYPPKDHNDPDYHAIRDEVRRIADYIARHQQVFCLETGQETAEELNHFLDEVARDNVRINFDPANMILYGTGDPIEALGKVAPRVHSVHCKDGVWPPKDNKNALGSEKPLGQGDVGMPRFLAKLKEIGYQGPLIVEREVESHAERLADMKMGIELLQGLL